MQFSVNYKSPNYARIDDHFLLRGAELKIKLFTNGGTFIELDEPSLITRKSNGFSFELGSYTVIKSADKDKAMLKGMVLRFAVVLRYKQEDYQILNINQRFLFSVLASKANQYFSILN